jgi:hypothetical protein
LQPGYRVGGSATDQLHLSEQSERRDVAGHTANERVGLSLGQIDVAGE